MGARSEVAFTGEIHPAAEAWPMLPADELDQLAASIGDVGLLEPIAIDTDGRLLDGRNRLEACRIAKTEPVFVVVTADPVSYIVGKNSDRRHMTTGARAMATAVVLADAGRRKNGRWARGVVANPESGNSGKTWLNSMTQAGAVIDFVPGDAPKVIAGDMALDAAYKKALQTKEAGESYDARLKKLAAEAPDLAKNVTDDASLIENEAALRARKDEEEKHFRQRVKWAQDAASSWAFLKSLAERRVPSQADVLNALNDIDRGLITEAITVIRKGK